MIQQKKSIIDKNSLALVLQELNENPHQKLIIASSLMSVIPFLVFFYLLASRLFTLEILVGEVGFILAITIFISFCGFYLGYSIIKKMLNRTIFYAAQARHSDQLKSTFVATVSHELKNPVSVIKLNLFNIIRGLVGTVNEEQKKVIELCRNVTERMGSLITDLLDLHKIEAGMVGGKRNLCNLVEILEKQLKEFETIFIENGVKLIKKIPTNDLSIWGYEDKIVSVINNLLSNALKYTGQGGEIVLNAFSTGGVIRLECIDTGPGIPSDKLEKIFDKFERLDFSKEGSGLGLAITKDIVELHKGKIWAESELGKGTKFVVVLPTDLRQVTREETLGWRKRILRKFS